MQVILRQLGDCNIRRTEPSDLIPVMEINLKTLPEHYSDYFYESLLAELPEAFIVAEIGGKHVGYIMCKTEYGFSNFKKLGFVKKGHVVSIAVVEEHRKKGIGKMLIKNAIKFLDGESIYVVVKKKNWNANKFYTSLGFLFVEHFTMLGDVFNKYVYHTRSKTSLRPHITGLTIWKSAAR